MISAGPVQDMNLGRSVSVQVGPVYDLLLDMAECKVAQEP